MDTVPCSLKYAQAGPEQVQIIGCKVRTKHNCTSLVARGKFDSFLVPCGAELQRSSFPLSQAIAGGMASGSPASAVSPADSRTCAWRARARCISANSVGGDTAGGMDSGSPIPPQSDFPLPQAAGGSFSRCLPCAATERKEEPSD